MSNEEQRQEPTINSPGFDLEDEFTANDEYNQEQDDSTTPERLKRNKEPIRKTDVWRSNISSVYGQGAGRIFLWTSVFVVVVLVALAVRNFTKTTSNQEVSDAQFDAPGAPETTVSVDAVSEKEATRRYEQSNLEAEQAAQSGSSYQPGFIPNISDSDEQEESASIFESNVATVQSPSTINLNNASDDAERERRALAEARERRRQAYEKAIRERDEYVTAKQQRVLDQLDKMLGQDSLNKLGMYTSSVYPIKEEETAGENNQSANQSPNEGSSSQFSNNRKPVIRTGNILYAETISEINTDDSKDVLAVVRGGQFDGARLIGSIEMQPDNIGVKFSTLAPQDGRNAMSINAIALRVEDAKQGIAEDINHHTLARYAALGLSSLLTGFGKAFEQMPGTTVIAPSGAMTTTTSEPSNKHIIASTVGEIGSAASQEIQRGFDRPPTYKTPAGHGLAVFFLSDVMATD